MACARILYVTVILVSMALDNAARRIPLLPPLIFPAIYNFGDSNSDTGGISAAFGGFLHHMAKVSFQGLQEEPEHLGLPYLSSYLDSIGTNFGHGANFAAGGSAIRRQNETIFQSGISPFSLDVQTVHLIGSKRKILRYITENDLVAGFRQLSTPRLRAAIPDIVNQLAAAVTHLYQQGARAFWIHNTGPVGCLPTATLYIRKAKTDKYGCNKDQNGMALEFNRQLKARVSKLRAELPQAALVYVDVYSAKYHLISNTKTYGFMDPLKICCGHHESNIHVWCGQRTLVNGSEVLGVSCGSPDSYISWDGIHYSQAANQWIANHILNGSFSDPPLTTITQACPKH
ncbi:UNVERIFIED_CONTAM: GDSL esterase/lipase [Sesamum radiatum]|uniref:GDSL esterase/lipase n=1 Tax=Sesamum radiatum TaxID=300843 RepID=A0AAW2V4G3_SESRA